MSKDKFFKAYANLPDSERVQVIVIINGKPCSWDRAYDNISSNTELGKLMLKKLEDMKIL